MNMRKWTCWAAILCALWCTASVTASAMDLSLSAGAGSASAGWINEQLSQYSLEYREPLSPIRHVIHARLGVSLPEWNVWRIHPAIGFDLRTGMRGTEGGSYSADLMGVSLGGAAPLGRRLTAELSVVGYYASFEAPEREEISLSGWGVGGRLELKYRLALSERLGLEIGILGDLANVGLSSDRDMPTGMPEVNFSGIGVSIGIGWRGGQVN